MDTPRQTTIKVASSARPLQIQRGTEFIIDEPSMRKKEYFVEEIDHRTSVSIQRPLTVDQLLSTPSSLFNIFYFALLVLASAFVCIATDGEIPLVYVLPAVSIVSLLSFHQLKL